METNQKHAQELPAQNIIATTVTEEPQLSYDPQKADRIAKTISELLDPEYVLLFGKLANGTPHSDILAYDLLAITDGPTRYDWYAAKRYLKMKLPYIGHGAPYVNIYVYSRQYIDANVVPFFYWARKEGIVLHSSRRRKLSRPRNEFDFGYAATLAKRYAGIFMPPADRLADYAEQRLDGEHMREAAFAAAQAAVYYYRTLFYVYHGFEADTCDTRYLHHRLRTLSGELPLLFESDDFHAATTLRCLNGYVAEARYDPKFFVEVDELSQHIDRVKRLGEAVKRVCDKRIGLYEKR